MKNNRFRIIFFGTPSISVQVLKAIYALEQMEIVGVVSQPNRLRTRHNKIVLTPVADYAIKHNLNLLQPTHPQDIFDHLATLKPDIILTCAYGHILPADILALPRYKALNVHASLLPKWRGGAPIARSIMALDTFTGITIMSMVPQMDAGPYFKQQSLPIAKNDTTLSLTNKLADLARRMIANDLMNIVEGRVQSIPQSEQEVVYAPIIQNHEARILWDNSAIKINALVRAMFDNPIAYSEIANQGIYKIHVTELFQTDQTFNNTPGTVVSKNTQGLIVQTGDGLLLIKVLQKAGKKPAPAFTYNNLVGKQFI